VFYLDTSAFVKLVIDEPHSGQLRRMAHGARWIGSEILRVEVPLASELLDAVMMVPVNRAAVDSAARLTPPTLRSLDAIHLAAALSIPGLTALLTYDDRLAEAARLHGVPVRRPGVLDPAGPGTR
jgi:uncharacterized protein